MKWRKEKFIKFVKLQRGHDLTKEQFVNGPYPVISSTSIIGYHQEYKAEGPGVIIGRSGTLGKVQYVSDNYWPHNTALYVKDFQGNLPRFVYYFLCGFNSTKEQGGGSAVPTLNRNSLSSIEVKIPDVTTQYRIATILSAYDDLIENNQRQIKLLEEAAIRLYKEWFVRLHFPEYKKTHFTDNVPEGWKQCILDEVIDFDPTIRLDKSKTKKAVPMAALSTKSMVIDEMQVAETTSNSGSKFSNEDTLLAKITPCLENGKTAFVNFLEDYENAVGSTEFIVMRSKKLNPYMVYCIARNEDFRARAISSMTGADGRQRVKVDKLKAIEYLLPTSKLIRLCEEQLKPMFDKIGVLNTQCKHLRQTRDILLPKLMNGEIEV